STVRLKLPGDVHLVGLTEAGQALTIDARNADLAGTTADVGRTPLVRIEGPVLTGGGDLAVTACDGVTGADAVLVSTRHLASPAGNHETDLSTGNSGALKLSAFNPDPFNPLLNVGFDTPTITLGKGSQLFAQAKNAGGTTYTGGAVELSATNINYS